MNTKPLKVAGSGKPDRTLRYEITGRGRRVLHHLLKRSVPCLWGSFNRTCVAAKLCFLEYLDPEEIRIQIEDMAQVQREGIESLRKRCTEYSNGGALPRHWLHHEIERYQWELTWLDRLRSDMQTASEPNRGRADSGDRSSDPAAGNTRRAMNTLGSDHRV